MPRLAPQPNFGEVRAALEVFFEAIGDQDAVDALSRPGGKMRKGHAVRAWATGALYNVGRETLQATALALGMRDHDSAYRCRLRYGQRPEAWRRLWEKAIRQFADFCSTEFRTQQRHDVARMLFDGFEDAMRWDISPKSRRRVRLERKHLRLLGAVAKAPRGKYRLEKNEDIPMQTLVDLGFTKRHRKGIRTPHLMKIWFTVTEKGRDFLAGIEDQAG